MNSEATAYFSGALVDVVDSDASHSASSPVAIDPNGKSTMPLFAGDNSAKERSDEDLLLQVSNGSKEALSILFRRHARPVFNVAHRILRDTSEAEDLLQEIFLFLFQKATLFDEKKSSASSWIIQMTYHRAFDRRRYLNARHHYNVQEVDDDRQSAAGEQLTIDEIAARTLLEKVREELSPEQRQTLELHFFEGYTFHEIAERTGQVFGNVRHHYYRGLAKLRSHVFPEK